MARRKARIPQGKKIQPSVDTLYFEYTITDDNLQTDYIDLSQCASLMNRRFYRQGLQWQVAGFKIFTSDTSGGQISILKVPNTWVSSNSWEKGFRVWQDVNNDSLEHSESIRPKFLDFKVFADAAHHQAGEGANLLPIQGTHLTAGDWNYSEIIYPLTGPAATTPGDTTYRNIIWVGGNYPGSSPATGHNAVSLIDGYAASRGLPDTIDPNVPVDAGDIDGGTPENWMAATQNEGTSQSDNVVDEILDNYRHSPYPYENDGVHTDTMYPGGANQGAALALHDFTAFSPTTVSETNYMKGGLFNGGLIKIASNSMTAGATVSILIDLVPGPHRGYMARPMQDV